MQEETSIIQESYQRITAFLNRNQEDILDKVGKDATIHARPQIEHLKLLFSEILACTARNRTLQGAPACLPVRQACLPAGRDGEWPLSIQLLGLQETAPLSAGRSFISTRCKLSRSKTMSCLVDLLPDFNIDGKVISSLAGLNVVSFGEPVPILKETLTSYNRPHPYQIYLLTRISGGEND